MTDLHDHDTKAGRGPDARSDAEAWRDILDRIDTQVRREAARAVGAAEGADWATIGRSTDEAARRNAAKAAGLGEGASWEEIGRQIERTTRGGMARAVGLTEDADWRSIGQTMGARVSDLMQNLFAPKKAPTPSADEKTEEIIDPWKPQGE